MTLDTNGAVAPAHLGTYQGVPVSLAILANLKECGDEFRASGFTFTIALPAGGYRSLAVQKDMHIHPQNYNLTPSPPAPPLAPVGYSRHGFGRAIDVISNAPLAKRDVILAAHGFKLWTTSDRNHYEWGNVLTPAEVSSIPLDGSSTPATLERLATVTALVMTKPGANVLAVFDESHWQEISYGAGVDPFLQQVADALQSSLPAAPYNDTGWNGRSNNLPGIKRPLYTIDVAKKTITPIASVTTGSTTVDLSGVATAAQVTALDAKVSAIKFPTKGTVELA